MGSEIITGLNLEISDIAGLAAALGTVGVSVQLAVHTSAAASIGDGTDPTKVALDTVDADTSESFSTVNNRFTPIVAGYYQLTAAVSGTASEPSALFQLALAKNGAWVPGAVGYNTGQSVGGFVTLQTAALMHFNGSTDFVELWGMCGDDNAVSAWMTGALT